MEAVNGEVATVVAAAADGDKGAPPPPSPLTGCYLLIVIGEPHRLEHKDIILQRVAKGLLSWDVNDCLVDLEKELAVITEQALDGEEARYGERLIQFASENLVTEILIHPAVSTLAQCVRNLLSSFTRHRHIIHAGYTFAANGSWALQDGTFSLSDFSEAFQEIEVQRVIRAYENGISLDIHCAPEGDWSRLPKESFARSCKVRVNPTDVLTSGSSSITSFISYISPFLVPCNLETLLESSEVVGNIRFSRPTLYVFPGGQGDAALFGINGFNMLLDGGFSRKACFWDFVRHLDRLDAVLMTRLNNSNVSGVSAVLKRKTQDAVYPQIGHFFCNIQERKAILSPDGDKDKDPLLINLLDEGQDIISSLRHLNLNPQVCYRDSEPINLYHKVGHGTLDMYVLSPAKDSKEVREFLLKWNNSDQKLFANQKSSREFNFPVQNLVSICALLVWQPANPEDTITRILFPGSTPQKKVFEGLDRLKQLDFIKHAVCSEKSLIPPVISKVKPIKDILDKPIMPKLISEKKENKTTDNILRNGDLNGIVSEKTAIVKKSDSTESEKSNKVKEQKIIENGDKEKAKMKPKAAPKLRSDSQQRRKPIEKKASPTTPKKTASDNKLNGDIKKSISKASPTGTPAKSAKDANNRKVIESKKTAPKKEPAKKEVVDTKPKTERVPISRRPKSTAKPSLSPAKKMNGIQKPDSISRRGKLEKEGTDSSTVSTPSADQESIKKDVSKLTPEELQVMKAEELADLKEEQEAVREIEDVFRKSEEHTEAQSNLRKVKDGSIDDKFEPEEFLIIEKVEVPQDPVNENVEDETQKHTRDSEESEKQRKLSNEVAKETVEQIEEQTAEIKTDAEDAGKEAEVPAKELEEKDKEPEKDIDEENNKEVAQESQPDEKGSANIESGATTTAPTLPEDERIPLDEIKEDIGKVVEEKHVKEETKEKEIPVINFPTKTAADNAENTKLPKIVGINLDKKTHIRDIVKTPDEVADLPVHEEVDYIPETGESDKNKGEQEIKEDITTQRTIDQQELKILTDAVKLNEGAMVADITIDNEKVDDKEKASVDQEPEVGKKELSKSPDEEKEKDEHEVKQKDEKDSEDMKELKKSDTECNKLLDNKIVSNDMQKTEKEVEIDEIVPDLKTEKASQEIVENALPDVEETGSRKASIQDAAPEKCDTPKIEAESNDNLPKLEEDIKEKIVVENKVIDSNILENVDKAIKTELSENKPDELNKEVGETETNKDLNIKTVDEIPETPTKENKELEKETDMKHAESIRDEKISLVKDDVDQMSKLGEKLQELKTSQDEKEQKMVNELVELNRKTENPEHAESVIIVDSAPETPEVEDRVYADLPEKMELGRKSPKEREEDVIKIVASVAEVLKSDAPLEEFAGKIPFSIPYTTELRETHITTVDSPIVECKLIKNEDIPTIPEEPICRKPSLPEEEEEPKKESLQEKRSSLIKESQELMMASSKMISDIKLSKSEEAAEDVEVGTVHRMLVTRSSEDGGEEIEICPPGTITFSRSSESSGRSSPDPLSHKKSSIVDTISDSLTTVKPATEILSEKDSGIDELKSDTDQEKDKESVDNKSTDLSSSEVTDKNATEVKTDAPMKSTENKIEEKHDEEKDGVSKLTDEIKIDAISENVRKESIPLTDTKSPVDLSGKSTPDIKVSSEYLNEGIEESQVDLSGKSTPDVIFNENLENGNEIRNLSGRSTPDIKITEHFESETPFSLSGNSTPDIKEDKVSTGKEDVSGKSKDEVKEDVISTPKGHDSGKSTPDVKEDKIVNHHQEESGKSTPEINENKISTPKGHDSGKSTPEIKQDKVTASTELDSGKSTPEIKQDKVPASTEQDSGKSTPEVKEKMAVSQEQESGKATPEINRRLSDAKGKDSGKSTPEIKDDILTKSSKKSAPEVKDKISAPKEESGKSTPLSKESSGKSTPEIKPDMKEPTSGKSTPEFQVEPISLAKELASVKSTQETKEDLVSKVDVFTKSIVEIETEKTPREVSSGKSTPDIKESSQKQASGKSTPDVKEIGKADLQEQSSGKSTPDLKLKDEPSKTVLSGKSTPEIKKEESAKLPEVQDLKNELSAEKSGSDLSGKSMPDYHFEDSKLEPEKPTVLPIELPITKTDMSQSAVFEKCDLSSDALEKQSEMTLEKSANDINDTIQNIAELSKSTVFDKCESPKDKLDKLNDEILGKAADDINDSYDTVADLSKSVIFDKCEKAKDDVKEESDKTTEAILDSKIGGHSDIVEESKTKVETLSSLPEKALADVKDVKDNVESAIKEADVVLQDSKDKISEQKEAALHHDEAAKNLSAEQDSEEDTKDINEVCDITKSLMSASYNQIMGDIFTKAEDTKTSIKSDISEKVEQLSETSEAMIEESNKKVEELASTASLLEEKTGKVVDTIQNKSEELLQEVKDNFAATRSTILEQTYKLLEESEKKSEATTTLIKEETAKVVDKLQEQSEQITKEVTETKSAVLERSKEICEEPSKKIEEKLETVTNLVKSEVNTTIDNLLEKSKEVSEASGKLVSELGATVTDLKDSTINVTDKFSKDLTDTFDMSKSIVFEQSGKKLDECESAFKDVTESTAKGASDTFDLSKSLIFEKSKELVEAADEKLDEFKSGAKDVKDTTERNIDDFSKDVSDKFDMSKSIIFEKSNQVVEQSAEAIKDVKEATSNLTEKVSKDVNDALESTKSTLSEKAKEAKDEADKKIDELKDAANTLKEATEKSLDDVKKQSEELSHKVSDTIESSKSAVSEKSQEVMSKVEEKLDEVSSAAKSIKEETGKSIDNLKEESVKISHELSGAVDMSKSIIAESKDVLHDSRHAIESESNLIKEESEKTIEKCTKQTKDVFDNAKSAMIDSCSKVSDKLNELLEDTTKKIDESKQTSTDTFDMAKSVLHDKYAESSEKAKTEVTNVSHQIDSTIEKTTEQLSNVFDMTKSAVFDAYDKVFDNISDKKDANEKVCRKESKGTLEESFDMSKSVIFDSDFTDPLELKSDVTPKSCIDTRFVPDLETLDVAPAETKKLSISDVEISLKEETLVDPKTACLSMLEAEKALYDQTCKIQSQDEKSTPIKDQLSKTHIQTSSTPPSVPSSPLVTKKETEMKKGQTELLKEQDLRSSTPGSDDCEIVTSHSDVSTGEISRAPITLESEPLESDEDDDVPGSPMSITSQVAHSRSSSHYDFEEDASKLPAPKTDPMNTSLYGALPDESTTSPDPTYLYEITKAKFATTSIDIGNGNKPIDNTANLDQINKNGQTASTAPKEDLMSASFIGELPDEKVDPIASWGKPLGLPSPAPPSDNKATPKKERKLPSTVSAKNKLNDDRKRSESPTKYRSKKINPIYVDLTYVPHHGNANYSYVDFFKRIRARYYVFSGIEPSKEVYNALLEGKQTWEDKDLEVTIIPTYDTDILGYWVAENEELLAKYKIDLSPSASRCTINLQDHETSCSAYRLEF